ncbi:MAG: hypothetical protein WCP28_01720 [Actinomycetes bacterium]
MATGYNLQISVRIEDSRTTLDHVVNAISRAHETEAALATWGLRVVEGPGGYIWALVEAVVQADSPGEAARIGEHLMAKATGRLPSQRSSSSEPSTESPVSVMGATAEN